MNGNFTELNLQGGGRKLSVRGWVVWEAGDERADLSITVTQGTVTGSAPTTVVNPDGTWEAEITLNGTDEFSKGIAVGQAGAVVTTNGAQTTQSWNSGPLQIK